MKLYTCFRTKRDSSVVSKGFWNFELGGYGCEPLFVGKHLNQCSHCAQLEDVPKKTGLNSSPNEDINDHRASLQEMKTVSLVARGLSL